jgi:hypothetical protein
LELQSFTTCPVVGKETSVITVLAVLLLKLCSSLVKILRLNRIIPSVHLFALVADNLHGCHRINWPCGEDRGAVIL